MRRVLKFSIVIGVLCLWGTAWAGEILNLVGTWEGPETIHIAGKGMFPSGVDPWWIVKEHFGRVFTGTKYWIVKDKTYSEPFIGVVAHDNEIYIAEHEDGFTLGDYVPSNFLKSTYLFMPYNPIPGLETEVCTQNSTP